MEKEIISHFRDKPKTNVTWWSFSLGLVVLFSGPILGISAAFLVPFIARVASEQLSSTIGFSVMILVLGLVIAALTTGIISYRKGERSWVMWVGLIPAIFAVLMWVFMLIGELLFPH